MIGRTAQLVLLGLAVVATPVLAQRGRIARAFDLERRGNFAEAASSYVVILQDSPADITALLGIERALTALGRQEELAPLVAAALAVDSLTGAIYGVGVRTFASLGRADSLEAMVDAWARTHPGDETPYREWGKAELRAGDREGARLAYHTGRSKLGDQSALAAELAMVAMSERDYLTAADEWVLAATRLPGYHTSALGSLGAVPTDRRSGVLDRLDASSFAEGRRLGAELRARWGDPLGGFSRLAEALPSETGRALDVLRQFAEQLNGQRFPEALAAQGMAYQAMADRSTGTSRARLMLQAAQSYAEAGDQESARNMLGRLAADDGAPRDLVAGATATLVEVLIAEGDLAAAESQLDEVAGSIPSEDLQRLRRRVAWGWILDDQLDRAAAIVERDSSVDGFAVAGYVQLYRGDVGGALELFQLAGPYAGSREQATDRTRLLALLQPLADDSVPELGRGLLLLTVGDTAAAVERLAPLAERLAPDHGGSEVQLLLGRIAVESGDSVRAESYFRSSAAGLVPGTAPAAHLALARLLIAEGRAEDAVATLEEMILSYPQSALVPQARRLLDEARGGIPSI